jgi:hypothetical protein
MDGNPGQTPPARVKRQWTRNNSSMDLIIRNLQQRCYSRSLKPAPILSFTARVNVAAMSLSPVYNVHVRILDTVGAGPLLLLHGW